ncbi:hypothetical protein LCGC14_2417810, partial [marine sediment metagenome]
DWPTRLDKYFEDCADNKFEYGVFDCAIFIADGILAMTGVDIIQEQRGKYKNEVEAKSLIRIIIPNSNSIQAAFDLIIRLVVKENKFKEVDRNFAQRGCLVLLDEMLNNSLGLLGLDGRQIYCPHPEEGLFILPIHHGCQFWNIE